MAHPSDRQFNPISVESDTDPVTVETSARPADPDGYSVYFLAVSNHYLPVIFKIGFHIPNEIAHSLRIENDDKRTYIRMTDFGVEVARIIKPGEHLELSPIRINVSSIRDIDLNAEIRSRPLSGFMLDDQMESHSSRRAQEGPEKQSRLASTRASNPGNTSNPGVVLPYPRSNYEQQRLGDSADQQVISEKSEGQITLGSSTSHAPRPHSSPNLVSRDSVEPPLVSFVMPTKNEEQGIGECIDRAIRSLEDLGITGEIIVSDSSTDRTPEIADENGAIVVEPDQPGYGYAYRYAFERARGAFVVMGDADTTYDFGELPGLLTVAIAEEADIVLGSRFRGEIKDGAMPWLHRHIGNPLLTKFLNTFYGANVTDAHSGFRVLRREALEKLYLEANGMEFASEMIMDAAVKDLKISELPITYHPRKGEATLNTFEDGWRHVKFMLTNAPGIIFSIPAVALGVLGILVMMLSSLGSTTEGIYFGSHTMIVGSLFTIVGYQVGSLALFSSIIANSIRQPSDPITGWIRRNVRLEHGASLGILLFGIGSIYGTYLVVRWVESGYAQPPSISADVVAITAIILGIQTIFSSFFLSIINGH